MYQNSNGGSRALEPTRGKGKAKNKMAVALDFTWGIAFFFPAPCRSPLRNGLRRG